MALAAAGLVLAVGATASAMAAWTDTEWVWGSAGGVLGGEDGLATSVFAVQQNTGTGDAAWSDRPTSATAGAISFTADAASLAPGDTVYGFVRLRTVVESVAGTVVMKPALPGDGTDTDLFGALTFGARVMSSPTTCSAAGFASNGTAIVAPGTPVTSTADAASFTLAAAGDSVPGEERTVCVALTLPAGSPSTLQGLQALPVWQFVSTSN
ncbi:acyl-CoA dehydrogenase [Naasia sp. SYSU D00948]|uniref:acyl-CoA dehydrogenase n=1 Tax=Naasia sp. SYSU D00948 TaxID=2817379 RepID=UPI001B3177AA|nr:acyl-CoA dehydrogenase [Naasia sp. SYSU D00948]